MHVAELASPLHRANAHTRVNAQAARREAERQQASLDAKVEAVRREAQGARAAAERAQAEADAALGEAAAAQAKLRDGK